MSDPKPAAKAYPRRCDCGAARTQVHFRNDRNTWRQRQHRTMMRMGHHRVKTTLTAFTLPVGCTHVNVAREAPAAALSPVCGAAVELQHRHDSHANNACEQIMEIVGWGPSRTRTPEPSIGCGVAVPRWSKHQGVLP